MSNLCVYCVYCGVGEIYVEYLCNNPNTYCCSKCYRNYHMEKINCNICNKQIKYENKIIYVPFYSNYIFPPHFFVCSDECKRKCHKKYTCGFCEYFQKDFPIKLNDCDDIINICSNECKLGVVPTPLNHKPHAFN